MRFRIVTIQDTRLRSCAVGHAGVRYPCTNALSSNAVQAVVCVSVQVRLLGSVNTFTLTIVVQQTSVILATRLLLDLVYTPMFCTLPQ